jgi:hypothetical protein
VSKIGCFIGFNLLGELQEDGGTTSDRFVPGKNAYTP